MKPYQGNPRKISKKQFERLKSTLSEYGDLSGVVHDLDTDEVLGGNQRVMALQLKKPHITTKYDPPMPDGTVAVGYFDVDGKHYAYRAVQGWDENKRRLANLVANHGGGVDDWDLLANYDPADLLQVGFDDEMLAAMKQGANALETFFESEGRKGGEEILLDQAVQLEPTNEYVMIVCAPGEFDKLREVLKLQEVRRGGYKIGSPFESTGIERVVKFDRFMEIVNARSDTK